MALSLAVTRRSMLFCHVFACTHTYKQVFIQWPRPVASFNHKHTHNIQLAGGNIFFFQFLSGRFHSFHFQAFLITKAHDIEEV